MSTFNTVRDAALEYIKVETSDATPRKKEKAFQKYENCFRVYVENTLKYQSSQIEARLKEELRKEFRGY